MRKGYRAGIVLSSFFCWAGVGTPAVAAERPAREPAPPAEEAVATKRFVVRVADGVDPAVLASRIGARLVASPEYAPGYHVYESRTTAAASIAAAKAQRRADVLEAEVLVARQQHTRDAPDDLRFTDQWHLENTGQNGGTADADVNITPWWDFANDRRLGNGVNIAIVDDGLEIAHPDLAGNYKADLSTDINGGDSNPSPGSGDNHGTAVAGVAAAFGDNTTGVSGAAPRAGLSGIRLIAAPTTDLQEANALTFQNDNQNQKGTNDIYSNSWGPSDNGRTLAGPGPLMAAALESTATKGRGGRGGVIVWAGGNGGSGDNANYDGYANNRHVIAVGATTNQGEQASYSEDGANLFVNAPSSGGTLAITTTDRSGSAGYNTAGSPGGDYTNTFGGTSSAAPLVSGVVALVLEANPNLTARDVKHILARSSEKNDPTDPGWTINAGGRHHNHKYGFGRVDATAAATMAKDWVNVGAEISTGGSASPGLAIPDGTGTGGIGFGAPVASTILITDILNVETVEVTVDVTHTWRGDLEFILTAPTGTSSVLGTPRSGDSADNYNDWTFTTVRNWDELSDGLWTLSLRDAFSGDTGTFNSWSLDIFGTAVPEPTGLAALILPGMALLMRRRRRA